MAYGWQAIVTPAIIFVFLCKTSGASGDGASYGDGVMFLGGDGEIEGLMVSVGGITNPKSDLSSKRCKYCKM